MLIGAITMEQGLTFLLLGLGSGAAYAIAGIGLVQIYRGSGVINFAHGGVAFLAAAVYAQFSTDWDWPWIPSFAIALLSAVGAGILIQLLVMRPLRNAAVLVRMVATVGVLAVIEEGIPLALGNITQRAQTVKYYYPKGGIDLIEGTRLTYDRLIMVVVSIALGLVMATVMKRTRFGLATTAVAEDRLVAESMKVNPDRVALVNWAIGGGLAGLTGLLMVPWASLVPATFVLLVVPALVAALIGRLQSFSLTVIGGLGLGAVQSLLFLWQSDPDFPLPTGYRSGWSEALPFILMIILLASRGSVFPRRDEVQTALPAVGRMRLSPVHAVGWAVLLAALAMASPSDLSDSISTTAGVAIVGLSVLVVTGLAGQISLAQMAIAGVGTMVAARLSGEAGWPFIAVILVAIVAGSIAGFIFGLPALRTRGPTLAVATIGLGVAIETTVFVNQGISGASFSGIPIERPDLFGWDINAIEHANRFAAVSVVLLVGIIYVVSNLRAGPVGRRMLAVRSNERAAAALGMSVQRIKLLAFVMGAGIVNVGGIVLTFQFDTVNLRSAFGFTDSLLAVVLTLIGGIGYILGPLIGAAISPSGLVAFLFNDVESIEQWLIVIAGVIVTVQLIIAPDGIVHDVQRRQAELADYRTALRMPESMWRRFGMIEVALAVGLAAGLLEWLRPLGWAAAAGIIAAKAWELRRQTRLQHPLVFKVPAGTMLFLTTVHLGTPRLIGNAIPDQWHWLVAWVGVATLAAAGLALWVDRRRDRDLQGRVSLTGTLVTLGVGLYLFTSILDATVHLVVLGMVVALGVGLFGLAKFRQSTDELRSYLHRMRRPGNAVDDASGVGGEHERRAVKRGVALEYEVLPADTGPRRGPESLVIEGLVVRYGPVVAVDGLSVSVAPGEIVGLIGPNGAGKTSAIDAISGFSAAASGTIELGGHDLTRLVVHKRARMGLGRTFQAVEPFNDLTVAENLATATEQMNWWSWATSFARIPKLRMSAATGRVIQSFELDGELTHFPNEMPQGRRRLLGVARALAGQPSVLLLDEPAAGLDERETAELGDQLRRVAREQKIGMLLVEHDMSLVTSICDRVVALDFGKMIFSGPADEVLGDRAIRAAYLGEEAVALTPAEAT